MADEIFKEVGEDDLAKVLEALKHDWPRHFLLHQILTVLDEYKKSGCRWKHSLYLCGTFKTGVYLNHVSAELPSRTMNSFHVYTPDCDLTAMKNCMLETKLIPWHTREFHFEMTQNRFSKTVEEAFTSHGLNAEVSYNTMFWYPPQKQLQLQPLPDEVYLQFLDESHADEMDRNWPHRRPGSVLVHKENLLRNFGLGLFRKSDKKLVSSALSNYTGGIFVLYSDLDFRGKGYGSLVVKHMVREIRLRGRIPFCTVIIGNKPSEALFTSTGFEVFTNADYIFPKH